MAAHPDKTTFKVSPLCRFEGLTRCVHGSGRPLHLELVWVDSSRLDRRDDRTDKACTRVDV